MAFKMKLIVLSSLDGKRSQFSKKYRFYYKNLKTREYYNSK